MGTHLAHELDHVELIAGDGRVLKLAEVAYLRDHVAQLVELGNGLAHGLVGGVHPQPVVQRVHHLQLQLGLVVVQRGLVTLHGRVDDRDEEIVVLDGVKQEEVLFHALHRGAALGAEEGAQVVVAALYRALEYAAHVGTVAVGHVVGGDVRRRAARRAQAGGEAPRQIQQYLGYVVAVVAQRRLPLVHGLGHKLVLRLLQQILKIYEVF